MPQGSYGAAPNNGTLHGDSSPVVILVCAFCASLAYTHTSTESSPAGRKHPELNSYLKTKTAGGLGLTAEQGWTWAPVPSTETNAQVFIPK